MYLAEFGIPWKLEDPDILISLLLGLAVILFLLIRFNIQYLSLPYWRELLHDRSARIEQTHNQVESELADIRHLRDDYAARLQQIEVEARKRIEEAVREADAAHTEIITDAQQLAAQLRRRSEEEMARERIRQRITMRQQIVQIALDAAEQSVRANSDDKVQRQLIGDFITRAAQAERGAAAASGSQGGV